MATSLAWCPICWRGAFVDGKRSRLKRSQYFMLPRTREVVLHFHVKLYRSRIGREMWFVRLNRHSVVESGSLGKQRNGVDGSIFKLSSR